MHKFVWHFLCLMVFLGLAQPVSAAEVQHARPTGEWMSEPVSDDGDTTIDFCLVRNYFSNGLIVILAEDRDGSRRLALNFPSSRLSVGAQHPVKLSIDNIWQQSFNAMAADDDMLVIPLSTAPRFWDRLASGYALTMSGPNDAVEFDLTGTGAAIEALDNCVRSRLSREPNRTASAAISDEGQVDQSATQAPPIPRLVEDILYNAGYKEISPVPLKGDTATRPLDYAWTMGNIFSGVKQIRVEGEASLRRVAEDYFKMIRPICKGPFVAEGAPVYEVAGIPFMRSEAGCSSDIKDTISALYFYQIDDVVTVFFFETAADDGADVIKARDRVARVAEEILSKLQE